VTDRFFCEHMARNVVCTRGVATQEPMVAEHVQLARLHVGLRRRLGHLVRVGQASLRIVAGQVAEEGEEPGIVDRDVRQEGA